MLDLDLAVELDEIRKKIARDRQKAVQALFATAERYRHLQERMAPRELSVFLTNECELPARAAASYTALNSFSDNDRALLESCGASADVVLNLSRERRDVRERALEMIRSGRNVQIDELGRIRRDLDHAPIEAGLKADPAPLACLHKAARLRTKNQTVSLIDRLDRFIEDLSEFVYAEPFDPFDERPCAIVERASQLHAELAPLIEGMVNDKSHEAKLWRQAISAIKNISEHHFILEDEWDPEFQRSLPSDKRWHVTIEEILLVRLARAVGQGHLVDSAKTLIEDFAASGRVTMHTDEALAAPSRRLRVLEICAGGGGQAIGLKRAGFSSVALIESNPSACATLRHNNLGWDVIEADIRDVDYSQFKDVDLIAGGVPCQPFSQTGDRRGHEDERDMFPVALDIIDQIRPKAVMLENVKGISFSKNLPYRLHIFKRLRQMGYDAEWRLMRGTDFNVPQARERMILVALQKGIMHRFRWPVPHIRDQLTVGEALFDLMSERGWKHAEEWARLANRPAYTIVGGSQKTSPGITQERSRQDWLDHLKTEPEEFVLDAPGEDAGTVVIGDFSTYPKMTVRMLARLQGFPDTWKFAPKPGTTGFDSRSDIPENNRVEICRQIANAFPPPMALSIGLAIRFAITGSSDDFKKMMETPLFTRPSLRQPTPRVAAEMEAFERENEDEAYLASLLTA